MAGEYGEKEDDEEKLSFVVLANGLKWDPSHEAFKIDRLFKHYHEFASEIILKCIFDHLHGCLGRLGNCSPIRALQQKRSDCTR